MFCLYFRYGISQQHWNCSTNLSMVCLLCMLQFTQGISANHVTSIICLNWFDLFYIFETLQCCEDITEFALNLNVLNFTNVPQDEHFILLNILLNSVLLTVDSSASGGPTPDELVRLLDQCDLSNSRSTTPSMSPSPSLIANSTPQLIRRRPVANQQDPPTEENLILTNRQADSDTDYKVARF